ncbi:MAG: hypothetical protein BWY45_03413 [Euryarchaeota archaeon ADurb.Bin294]|nr:MAG: hypothetical protein BWY45_03413 [Euryarchaeota archaeon ADurb.Bin294]
MLREPVRLRLEDLISSIQDHMEYLGLDVLIERVDENRLMITVPEC